MIDIVQVYTYKNNSGLSIRIGRGYDHHDPLRIDQCKVYEFVELDGSCVSLARLRFFRNMIRKLGRSFRGKEDALCELDGKSTKFHSSDVPEVNHSIHPIIKSAGGSWQW